MNGRFFSGYIALKKQVSVNAGLVPVNNADFLILKKIIENETGKYISLVALQRFFGQIPSMFAPSLYTLDTLALYCKHKSWSDFFGKSGL